jgi:hypothetical protein
MLNSKTIAVHVTSLLVGAAGVIALIHPGFVLPGFVVALVPTVCAFVVGALQTIHLVSKNTLTQNLVALGHIANAATVATAVKTVETALAPAPATVVTTVPPVTNAPAVNNTPAA